MDDESNDRKSCLVLNTHHELQKFTSEQIRKDGLGAQIVHDADQGVQTTVVSTSGRVRAVVGLNCARYLPDADPDPLDDLLLLAIKAKGTK